MREVDSIQGHEQQQQRRAAAPAWKSAAATAVLLMIPLCELIGFYIFREHLNGYALAAALTVDVLIGILLIRCVMALKAQIRRLQAAGSELKDTVLIISHEIKAPVRAIDGYTRIFAEDFGRRVNDEAGNMINKIRSICKDTLLLVDNLLDYIRIAEAQPKREVVALQELILSVFEELSEGSGGGPEATLLFESRVPPVMGDGLLLKLAVRNMVSNALKFTRYADGPVIRAGCRREKGADCFYISDNGAGFDMQYSRKLFEPFQRMHGNDQFEGTGLGLAIVKKVIQKHNGNVWIRSEVSKGTTVYFTLDAGNGAD